MEISKAHYDRLTDEIHTGRAVIGVLKVHLKYRLSGEKTNSLMTDQGMYDHILDRMARLKERQEDSLKEEREHLRS